MLFKIITILPKQKILSNVYNNIKIPIYSAAAPTSTKKPKKLTYKNFLKIFPWRNTS